MYKQRLWCRISSLLQARVNKRIALWAMDKSGHGCRNWYFLVRQNLDTLQYYHFNWLYISIPTSTRWRCVYNKMMDNFKQERNAAVTQPNSRNGQGRNKLPTYSQFKTEFCAEAYC